MKFTVQSTELQKALGTISGVVPSRSTLPILENVLFHLQGNTLKITGTDLEIWMIVEVKVNGEKDGAITIPAKRLFDTVKALPELEMHFNANLTENKATLKTKSGQYTLVGQTSLEYPILPTIEASSKIALPSATLRKYINTTGFAVSDDEMRAAMTGVLFQIRNNELKIVSTDGHRLVRVSYKGLGNTGIQKDIVVVSKALTLLSRSVDEGDMSIAVDTSHIRFNYGQTTVLSKLIEENYPNYESVIPLDNDKTLTVKRDELLSTVRRVSLYSSSSTHQIRFSLKKKDMVISAHDIDFGGEASETILCSYDSPDMEIGFNWHYINDALMHMDAQEIEIKMSTPLRAALIAPVAKNEIDEILMLVMPIRLNT